MAKTGGPRFTVRKQTSGYTGRATYFVYDLQHKGRVTVWPHTDRQSAQIEADGLNETLGWETGKPASKWTREDWDAHFASA